MTTEIKGGQRNGQKLRIKAQLSSIVCNRCEMLPHVIELLHNIKQMRYRQQKIVTQNTDARLKMEKPSHKFEQSKETQTKNAVGER